MKRLIITICLSLLIVNIANAKMLICPPTDGEGHRYVATKVLFGEGNPVAVYCLYNNFGVTFASAAFTINLSQGAQCDKGLKGVTKCGLWFPSDDDDGFLCVDRKNCRWFAH